MEGHQNGGVSEGTESVMTPDGSPLAVIRFAPTHSLGSAALIASGAGICRSFYSAFARYLAGRGHTVVTFDYRGIGDSRPARLRGPATKHGVRAAHPTQRVGIRFRQLSECQY